MPLFVNKFSPKRPPSRKASSTNKALEQLTGDDRTVTLKLGEEQRVFKDGEWIVEGGQKTDPSHKVLRNRLTQLEEENNFLRLKYEILLNMLTQTSAESHLQQREIEKLKKKQRS